MYLKVEETTHFKQTNLQRVDIQNLLVGIQNLYKIIVIKHLESNNYIYLTTMTMLVLFLSMIRGQHCW